MKKRTQLQSIRDILSYVQDSKGYKDIITYNKINNNKRDRKLFRTLIKTGFIEHYHRIYVITTDGIVLLTLIKTILKEME